MSSNVSLGGSLAGKSSVTATTANSKAKSETVNYLLLYENMVRHQDLEFDATHEHAVLTMQRIQRLGRRSTSRASAAPPALVDEQDEAPRGMLTYLQMRRCLLRLGYTWNRFLPFRPPGGDARGSDAEASYYDDDVSVLSTNSNSSLFSGGAGSASGMSHNSALASTRDIIATDAQLIMLLTRLVELEERQRAARLARLEAGGDEDEEKDDAEEDGVLARGLFLPEFVQAYKLIIGGMQSLQTYPSPEAESPEEVAKGCAALGLSAATDLEALRLRSRERTLGLLRMFGPDSSAPYGDDEANVQQSAGEDPSTPGRKAKDGLKSTKRGNKQIGTKHRKGSNLVAKDGLQPRLSDAEIRQMVHSKDKTLAKIMEEHESEMSVMANNMEELRLKSLHTQKLIRQRRKRTRVALAVGTLLALAGGGAWEFRRRDQVQREIAAGREAERLADARDIASLEGQAAALEAKLADAEATIRYEEVRYTEASAKMARLTEKLAKAEEQASFNEYELERCRATQKELDADLSAAKEHNAKIEEEVGWCRERLDVAERAMAGMERALLKTQWEQQQGHDGSGKGAVVSVPSFSDLTKELEKHGDLELADEESTEVGKKKKKKKRGKHKPVKMEMKYNKSFRNAVLLRQLYSALAGMAVSAVVPVALKAFGVLLL